MEALKAAVETGDLAAVTTILSGDTETCVDPAEFSGPLFRLALESAPSYSAKTDSAFRPEVRQRDGDFGTDCRYESKQQFTDHDRRRYILLHLGRMPFAKRNEAR